MTTSGPPVGARRIEFTPREYAEIRARAFDRAIQMRDKAQAYGSSDAEQNEVGLIGEVAVQRWMTQEGWDCDSIADGDGDGNSYADIAVRLVAITGSRTTSRIVGIEVKTSRLQDWSRFDRQLNAAQFDRMTCDAIVWCATGSSRPRTFVDVLGWLPRAGLTAVKMEGSSARAPRQVKIQEALRPPAELGAWMTHACRPTF